MPAQGVVLSRRFSGRMGGGATRQRGGRHLLGLVLEMVLMGSAKVVGQGEAEEDRVEQVVPEQAIEAHEEAAEVFVWASGGILGLMLLGLALSRSKAGLPTAAVATLGTLASRAP